MFLVWNPTLETGVAKIDEQHQQLIALINELDSAHQAGDDLAAFEIVLPRFADYAVFHFAMEEQLLASVAAGTPYSKYHLAEHEKFVRMINQMQFAHREDMRSLIRRLTVYLQLWLEDHIMGTDKTLAGMLLKRERNVVVAQASQGSTP